MKKASILTNLALGLLVVAGVAACKQGATGTPATSTSATTTPAASEAVVYVNSDTLMSKYDYAKDVDKRLEVKGKNAQSDLESKGQAFQREVVEYQKNAPTMPADQRQTTEQRLQREKQQLDAYQQNATAQFQDERGKENQKLYDKITEFVKGYAKEKGYKFVLTYSKTNPTILYGDASLDVTADVVKKLNDAYAKDTTK